MHGDGGGTAGRWLLQAWLYSRAVSTMTENKTREILHRWGRGGGMERDGRTQLSFREIFVITYDETIVIIH